jgi:hypothetical protein
MADGDHHISRSMMRQEIEREIKMRRQVYPRLIARRELRRQVAEFRIEVLEAVLEMLGDPDDQHQGANPIEG